jgi:hypothetical protein
MVLALSQNASPGMMYGKERLPFELGTVEHMWRDRGHFALLHDLTNCLRIGDLTEFTGDNARWIHEIRKKRPANKEQVARAQAAVNAIMAGADLPGGIEGRSLRALSSALFNKPIRAARLDRFGL